MYTPKVKCYILECQPHVLMKNGVTVTNDQLRTVLPVCLSVRPLRSHHFHRAFDMAISALMEQQIPFFSQNILSELQLAR